MDKSIEISNLIGNYIIKEENGEKKFEWIEGPLLLSV